MSKKIGKVFLILCVLIFCSGILFACNKKGGEDVHTEHEYGEWMVTVEPSCTNTGLRERICSVCDEKVEESIDSLGHLLLDPIKENVVDSTCEVGGNYDNVVYCERCEQEISRNNETTEALGHNYDYDDIEWDWSEQIVKAKVSCKNDNTHIKTLNALIISNVSDYVHTDTATVEIGGKKYEDIKSERVNFTIQWIWDADVSPVTAIAKVINAEGETEYPVEIDGDEQSVMTCTTQGKVVYTATFNYNDVTYTNIKTVISAPTGHSFGNWIIEKQASCSEFGEKYRVCANDETHIERETITKLSHSYGNWSVIKEATESENGTRERTCTACAHVQKETISYTGESLTEYTIEYRNLFDTTHTNPVAYTSTTNTITLTAPNDRDGYVFNGWYDSEKGGSRVTSIIKGSSDDKVLYAQWGFRSYTITYEKTYGAIANPASYTIDDEIIFLDPNPRNGYSFKEWQDEEKNVVTGIARGTKGNRTFEAVWDMHTYTITYENTQGVDNTNQTEYNVESAEITLIGLLREGYDFDGWYDEEENGKKITAISHGTYGDITLYARFTPKTFTVIANAEASVSYVVSFDGNGADISIENQTVTAINSLIYPDIPIWSGHIFAGWYENAECTGDAFDFSQDIRTDIALYAKWIENTGNTIKINENKSVYINGTTQVYYYFVPLVSGRIATYSSGSLDTYGYLYQNGTQLSSDDDSGTNDNFSITYNVTAGLLYAVSVKGYNSNASGTITLSLTGTEKPIDGGKADVPTFSVTYGQDYDFGVGMLKPGYKFVGYYTEANGEGTKLTDEEGKSLSVWTYLEDMDIYGSYVPTKYTITFDSQGGSEIESVEFDYGADVIITAKPTLSGKSFGGWYLSVTDEQVYVPSTMPAENFTLYAKWINYNLNDFTYNTKKTAIKISDEITADLFEATLIDTDGECVEITATIVEGEQTAGSEVSVRLLAQGKYNKRKSVTIDNIKVYSPPTLTVDNTRDYINLTEELNGEPFNAAGVDTFGNATVITAEIDGEYQGGDTVSVVINSIDPAGNVTSATVQNVKVYDKPVITYENINAAIESDIIDLAFFGATAEDSFGVACDVNFEKDGEQVVGGTVAVVLTSEDEKGNVNEIKIEVKIYGVPTINNLQKVDFKVSEDITLETLGATATDTHGGNVEDVTLTLKSGDKASGCKQVYTVTAVDLVGNEASRDFTVKIFGNPTIIGSKTAIKDTDNVEDDSIYGITARDSFGRVLVFTATVQGEQTVGGTVSVTFTTSDDAGNETTVVKNYNILSADDIVLTFNQGQSNVIKLMSKGEEFNASATDTMGNPCEISVVGSEETLAEGKIMNIVLRATDAAGNTKDSDVIENISVYSMPSVNYKKHPQWYLTAADGKTNLFRVLDSFGEELYSEETKVSETDDEYVVRVVADPDEAGNLFDQTLTLAKINAGKSIIDLYVDGKRIGSQTVNYDQPYTLPCPDGYRYTWKIDEEVITDNEGNCLNVWDKEDDGYTAVAEVELITFTVTYILDGGVNNKNNPEIVTKKDLNNGIILFSPTYILAKEIDSEKEIVVVNGQYNISYIITEKVFCGWYLDEEFNNETKAIATYMGMDNDIVLYAKWDTAATNEYIENTTEYVYRRAGDYIYFGEYPQTIKANNIAVGNTSDSDGYYLGSDGYRYAKMEASPFNAVVQTIHFSNDSVVSSGRTYYFKVEPIRWRILEENDGTAFIICDNIIANKAYQSNYDSKKVIGGGYQYYIKVNGVVSNTYANNYRSSEIYSWLNNEFAQKTFNSLQQELIQNTTNGKLFLLSYTEVTNSDYGFDDNQSRKMKASDYAKATGVNVDKYNGNSDWWLRSSNIGNFNGLNVDVVDDIGRVDDRNANSTSTDRSWYGVVPALKVSLN